MNIILAISRSSDMLFENLNLKFYLNLVQNLLDLAIARIWWARNSRNSPYRQCLWDSSRIFSFWRDCFVGRVTLHKNMQWQSWGERGKGNRNMWEQVFPLVFPEHVGLWKPQRYLKNISFFCWGGFETTQLAHQLHQERTQMEVQ